MAPRRSVRCLTPFLDLRVVCVVGSWLNNVENEPISEAKALCGRKRLVPSPSLYMSLFIITKTIELMARYEAPADTKAGTIGKYIWVLLGLMGHGQEFGE